MREIEERRAFLDQMAALGQDKLYRNTVETEISQRVRRLEIIDKMRSEELRDLEDSLADS